MSAFSTTYKPKKLNVLDQVVKKNPKYAHIESNLDTGSSITKYMKKLEEIKTNYRYQQNEIFKRMKITTFVQLVLQISNIDTFTDRSELPFENDGPVKNKKHPAVLATISDQLETDRHATLQSVISGVGEQDIIQASYTTRSNMKEAKVIEADDTAPYLLLDIRDRDEYDQCHIITALNYPIAMLSRSINNETKELLAYKNQEGKIILIYDEDEKIGTRAAATLVERGYDNLFMLSGGLKLAIKKFPEGLVTGIIPKHLIPHSKVPNKNQPQQESQLDNTKLNHFRSIDLEKLNFALDNSLLMSDTSSRLSRNSNNSDRKSTYSSASMDSKSSIHSQPWKPV